MSNAPAAAEASAAAAPAPPPNVEPPNVELDNENDDDANDDDLDADLDDEGSGVVTDVVGRFIFSRNVRLTRHPTRNTFGLQLQSPGEALRTNSIGCLVKAVLPSCTAPDGAVQAGDRILSVNGTTTLEWSYHQIVSFIKETNPDVLVLSLRRELPEAEVAKATSTAAKAAKTTKAAPESKTGTRETEGAGGTDAKEPGQSSAKGDDETKKKGEGWEEERIRSEPRLCFCRTRQAVEAARDAELETACHRQEDRWRSQWPAAAAALRSSEGETPRPRLVCQLPQPRGVSRLLAATHVRPTRTIRVSAASMRPACARWHKRSVS